VKAAVVVMAASVALAGCSNAAPRSLSAADQAVCDILASTVKGMNATGAVDLGALESVGWPNGQPSAEVRGVVNAFRSLKATSQDYLDGVASDADLTAAVNAALDANKGICG
jgi:hypothetical protein